MRTVTFSDPRIRNIFNQHFVNTHTNTEGDPNAGQSIRHRPGEPAGNCIRGNGKQNIQTIFMTPEGEIFHVATGYLPADDLLDEAKYALQLFGKLKETESDKHAALVTRSHRDRLNEIGESVDSGFDGMFRMMNSFDRPASSSAASGNPPVPGQMFQQFVQRQFREDQQFSIDRPLMSYHRLEQDPTPLVGNGKSFFASSSSGSNR
jgi:hypothetical protein